LGIIPIIGDYLSAANPFAQFGEITNNNLLVWGVLIFVSIFAYTAVMDKHNYGNYLIIVYPVLSIIYLIGFKNDLTNTQPLLYFATLIFFSITWVSSWPINTYAANPKFLDGNPA